ncbi:hypothetical protein SAMN05216203_1986 [Marinobacter daqiaonensis]|uniref:Uncharacterized protein n=1 Tax=Marinobacter daqiaonensis TaxID=650891 RepID=A0A1I6I9C0_9GAMM|nr:hypothetical protein SAMN05216203_1986 [Marinobacter daqiaonensis]
METVLVNLTGLVLMGAIVWWFWLSDSDAPDTDREHH